jgi:hypothetical protein
MIGMYGQSDSIPLRICSYESIFSNWKLYTSGSRLGLEYNCGDKTRLFQCMVDLMTLACSRETSILPASADESAAHVSRFPLSSGSRQAERSWHDVSVFQLLGHLASPTSLELVDALFSLSSLFGMDFLAN